MTVGERIRERRIELHLTQEELAKRMGYKSRTAISNVEKNLEDLTTTRVIKFAEALECTPADLMGWGSDTPARESERLITYARLFYEKKYLSDLLDVATISKEEDVKMATDLLTRLKEKEDEHGNT